MTHTDEQGRQDENALTATAYAEAETKANNSPRFNRRSLFTGGALGLGLGSVATALGAFSLQGTKNSNGSVAGEENKEAFFGEETLPCHGANQAGVVTPPGAHARFSAYKLRPETDAAALQRMFRLLTGDIEGLTSGDSPLADPEPELAERPARLTVTVGVGPELVNRVSPDKRPEWLASLPAFSRDKLGSGYDDGDLLILVQADDQLPVSHAHRMLQRDVLGFAEPLWTQNGFRPARGADSSRRTMRNLMGQIDGTVNPAPEDDDFDSVVWLGKESGWLAGGSALVIRRIRMELDTWDQVDRPGRDSTMGRRISDGSPLSVAEGEGDEFTPVDFDAKDSLGLSAIPMASHVRRSHSTDKAERIYRRAMNYDDGTEAGLVFACYQRDPLKQFVPIQQRLDEADVLNEWVTHVGSAVFAVLPGFKQGTTLGQSLFSV